MDRERLIGRAGHRFIKDTVTTIDPTKKKVYTSGRKRMPFDICVVAVGGVNNTSGIAGTAKFSLPFKSVEQCQNIARRLKTLTLHKHRVPVVIVGGGLEGVELWARYCADIVAIPALKSISLKIETDCDLFRRSSNICDHGKHCSGQPPFCRRQGGNLSSNHDQA